MSQNHDGVVYPIRSYLDAPPPAAKPVRAQKATRRTSKDVQCKCCWRTTANLGAVCIRCLIGGVRA